MSAADRDEVGQLSPEAVRFGLAFDRLSPPDQQTIDRLIDLLSDEQARLMIESLASVLTARTLDEARDAIPGLRSSH